MNDVVFDTDISFLDMWGYYVLIGFEDNHIEIYYMDSDETQKLCEYSFDNEISQAEINGYSAHCRVTVLLNNGELLTNTDNELGKLRQIAENIDSFSYNHGSIMYVNRNREVRLYSYYGHQYICEELQKLHDVIRVDAISFSSSQNGDFAFVLYRESDVFFVQYNTSFSDSFFVISEKKVEVEEAAPVEEVVVEDSAAKKAAMAEPGAVDLGTYETASMNVEYDAEKYELYVKETACFQFPLEHAIQCDDSITVHMTGINNGTAGFRCWTIDDHQTTNSNLYLDCVGEALAPGPFDITFTLTATSESVYFFVKAPS